MKPSQLLQKLKTVATSDISDNLIKTLWLEKLPESIKNILVVSDENLSKLAVMADKISDMTPRTEIFATGKSSDCGEATSSRDQLLLNRIQSLEEQICQLSILHKSRTKERNSFHPKSRSRSRKRFDPKGKYCYFHFRFGARCKPEKCSPPCTWNRNTEKNFKNAPSTFQRFINEVLFGLEFVFPYLDDILVASETEEEHKTHLKLVFDLLQKHGLRVNISKSTLGVTHLEFLGYLITPEGSKPLPEKVDAILSYKLPETIRDLRTFLGLINFYRRYLKDAAKNQAILHEYLKGSRKNDKTKILWTEEAKENFEKCKQDLANATLLSFPDPDLQLALFTDASNFAIGSVLQQFEAGNWKPISFFLKN
ncbi:retrovirus-related Pol polyprotein from transposon opus [Trichonephila clavipes]|nr:retrovirus-related Pol polyprotein from transposon opus [Trichonephila clavipes]